MSELETKFLNNLNFTKKRSSDFCNRLNGSSVNIYSPDNKFTTFKNYNTNEFISILEKHQKKNYLIIQINNDMNLFSLLMKKRFKKYYNNIEKASDLDIDYCFSPIQNLLFFNFSLISNFTANELSKDLIQIYIHENGLYILNNSNCNFIIQLFQEKFSFVEIKSENFWDLLKNGEKKEELHFINDINYSTILRKNMKGLIKMNKLKSNSLRNLNINTNNLKKNISVISSKGLSKEGKVNLI